MIETSGDQIQRNGKDVHARDKDAQRVVPRKVEYTGEVDEQAERADSPLQSSKTVAVSKSLSNRVIKYAKRKKTVTHTTVNFSTPKINASFVRYLESLFAYSLHMTAL